MTLLSPARRGYAPFHVVPPRSGTSPRFRGVQTCSCGSEPDVAKRFRAILEGVGDSSGTFVRVPDSVMQAFDGRVRVPVRIAVNGVEHRTTICDMGRGPSIGIPATVRRAARIEHGDRIAVSLEIDREERTVALPGFRRRDDRCRAARLRRHVVLAPQGIRAMDRSRKEAGDTRAPNRSGAREAPRCKAARAPMMPAKLLKEKLGVNDLPGHLLQTISHRGQLAGHCLKLGIGCRERCICL